MSLPDDEIIYGKITEYDLNMSFIDLYKAFDSIEYRAIINSLEMQQLLINIPE